MERYAKSLQPSGIPSKSKMLEQKSLYKPFLHFRDESSTEKVTRSFF